MEQANILFKGVVNEPNNFLHEDGELMVSMNAVVKNGSVKAVPGGKTLFKFADGYKLVHVHENDGNKYYIFLKKNTDAQGNVTYSLHYAKNPGQEVSAEALEGSDKTLVTGLTSCNSVTHFKKILVVSTGEGIRYARILGGEYKWLGALPQMPKVYPYLTTDLVVEDGEFYFNDNDWTGLAEERMSNFLATLNKARTKSKEKGRFNFPFFVRFAMRMYDGSYSRVSQPFLMMPTPDAKPYFLEENIKAYANITEYKSNTAVYMPESVLSACVGQITSDWEEIIEGIDVYVSPEIVEFSDDTNIYKNAIVTQYTSSEQTPPGKKGRYYSNTRSRSETIGGMFGSTLEKELIDIKLNLDTSSSEDKQYTISKQQRDVSWIYSKDKVFETLVQEFKYDIADGITVKNSAGQNVEPSGVSTITGYKSYNLTPNSKYIASADTKIICRAEGVSDCTLIKLKPYVNDGGDAHIRLGYVVATHENIQRTDGKKLSDLINETGELYMIDTIDIKNLSSEYLYTPNLSKQKLVNLTAYKSFSEESVNTDITTSVITVYNSRLNAIADGTKPAIPSAPNVIASAAISIDGNATSFTPDEAYVKIVEDGSTYYVKSEVGNQCPISAIRYLFYPNPHASEMSFVGGDRVMTIPLTRCDAMYGAYWFGDTHAPLYNIRDKENHEYTTYIDIPDNKIYVSEINNPFVFLAGQTINIDCERIIELCAATKPMSTGQFGEFPMYAFTDNGVYALGVSDTGTYSSVRPVSADVITGATTQLDQSVLFNTARGMMHIAGQDVQCMSEKLNGHVNFICSKTPAMCALAGVGNVSIPADIQEFMKDAQALYSYPRNMIYFFKDGSPMGYVYSIGDAAWGMYENKLSYPVGGYEQALAVMKVTEVVEDEEEGEEVDTQEDGAEDEPTTITYNVCVNYDDAIDDAEETNILLITRPVSFGDPTSLKTVYDIVGRGICTRSNMKTALLASNDGRNYHVIASSQKYDIFSNMGTPYRYFALAVMGKMKHQDSLNGFTCEYIKRLNNILR